MSSILGACRGEKSVCLGPLFPEAAPCAIMFFVGLLQKLFTSAAWEAHGVKHQHPLGET